MMRWFGPDHLPPFDDGDLVRAPAPIGERCVWCDEPILEGEYGFLVPHVESAGSARERPHHNECLARQMLGSVAHQLGLCTCVNPESKHEDPPGITRRQAAKAALSLARKKYKT